MCTGQEACGSWRAPGKGKAQQRSCYDSEEAFLLLRVKHQLLQFLHLISSHHSIRFYDQTDLRAGSAQTQDPEKVARWFLTTWKPDYSLRSDIWNVKTAIKISISQSLWSRMKANNHKSWTFQCGGEKIKVSNTQRSRESYFKCAGCKHNMSQSLWKNKVFLCV